MSQIIPNNINIAAEHRCITDFSVLSKFHSAHTFGHFSIKYVIRGTEHYRVNGTELHVGSGQYLMAGLYSKGTVTIDSKEPVSGICIDLSPGIITEVCAGFTNTDLRENDINPDHYFTGSEFPESVYEKTETHVGRFLQQIESGINKTYSHRIGPGKEFYYQLAACLIADNLPLLKKASLIKVVKRTTRKELFRKACAGKKTA